MNQEREKQLEESWTSLSFFNQTQRGRLSAKNTPELENSASSCFDLYGTSENESGLSITDQMQRLHVSKIDFNSLII